jgi:regulator of sirC expression with transglutaminase-like and TPR domain
MEARNRFASLVTSPAIPLDEALFVLADALRPPVNVADGLARLDALAAAVPEPTIAALRGVLFDTLAFRGNRNDYYDPENSYLDAVLDRRLGLPITLSALTVEVGRRLGLSVHGVGMPGHFLVGVSEGEPRFLDVFDGGRELDAAECEALYHRIGGAPGSFDPRFLLPVGPADILARVLVNLRGIAQERSDIGLLQRVLELRVMLPRVPPEERKLLARALASSGRLLDAAEQLDVLAETQEGEPAATLRRQAAVLRARCN